MLDCDLEPKPDGNLATNLGSFSGHAVQRKLHVIAGACSCRMDEFQRTNQFPAVPCLPGLSNRAFIVNGNDSFQPWRPSIGMTPFRRVCHYEQGISAVVKPG